MLIQAAWLSDKVWRFNFAPISRQTEQRHNRTTNAHHFLQAHIQPLYCMCMHPFKHTHTHLRLLHWRSQWAQTLCFVFLTKFKRLTWLYAFVCMSVPVCVCVCVEAVWLICVADKPVKGWQLTQRLTVPSSWKSVYEGRKRMVFFLGTIIYRLTLKSIQKCRCSLQLFAWKWAMFFVLAGLRFWTFNKNPSVNTSLIRKEGKIFQIWDFRPNRWRH